MSKDVKEEQMQIKTARNFFCLQNMGSECRAFMLKSYKNPRTPRPRNRNERWVFDGIFQAFNANQGELMMAATEEKLLNMKTVSTGILEIDLMKNNVGWRENCRDLYRANSAENGDSIECEDDRQKYHEEWRCGRLDQRRCGCKGCS